MSSVKTVTSGQPMPTAARSAQRQAVVVEDDRAGQDADDAEADGEVAEAAHRAVQLLRIAELVQVGDVLLDDVVAGLALCHRSLLTRTGSPDGRWVRLRPPSRPDPGAAAATLGVRRARTRGRAWTRGLRG